MVIVSGTDPLRDEAMKSHEENEKAYEEAMKENKEAIDLVSGDETKKKDGKVKSSELKKMHLSESLFEDYGFDDFEETDSEEEDSTDNPFMKDEKAWGRIKNYLKEDASFNFQSDLKSAVYNAISDVLFKYRNEDFTKEDIEDAVQFAVEWFDIHFFEDDENSDFFLESQHLEEDAGDDFLDKINKQILNVNEDLELNEENGVKSAYDIANDIIEEYPKDVDIYNHTPTGSTDDYYKIEFLVDGDWKHDHLAFKYWMNNNAAEISGCEVKYGGETPIEESDDDVYKAVHTYFFIPEKQEIQEPEIEEPQQEEEENMEEIGFDDDSIVAESLKEDWAEELDDLADKVSAFMSKNEKNYDKVVKYMDQLGYKDMNVGDVDASVLKKIVKKFKLDESLTESLKFQIAKEQLKRFNEGKMPKDWSPNKYLENLVKKNHLTEEQKNVLTEAFLK